MIGLFLIIIFIGCLVTVLVIVTQGLQARSRRLLTRRPVDFASRPELGIGRQDSNRLEKKGGDMADDTFFGRISRAFRSEPATPAPAAPAPALPRVEVDYEDSRIPDGAKEKVRRILACLTEVQTALSRETLPGFTQVDIEQMREEHLPKLIKSYIDIPPAHRAEIFRKTGKSASFILEDSLEQMQKRIDELLRNLAQKDLDAFTNNTRFVGERYSNHNPFD